ncbi:MAG: DNA-directed RNA polymerase subunit RpoH/Rpb5 C-terminal domain-containing protein [Candidatus Micrarchaeaceae archaeon]
MASDYDLVPEHELLSESDAKKIAKKFNTPLEKFPKILESDAQAVKLKASAGQLIAVHRNDDGKSYIAYRYVVKG